MTVVAVGREGDKQFATLQARAALARCALTRRTDGSGVEHIEIHLIAAPSWSREYETLDAAEAAVARLEGRCHGP